MFTIIPKWWLIKEVSLQLWRSTKRSLLVIRIFWIWYSKGIFFFFFYEHSQKGDKYLNTSTLYKNGQLGPHIEKVFSIGSQILQWQDDAEEPTFSSLCLMWPCTKEFVPLLGVLFLNPVLPWLVRCAAGCYPIYTCKINTITTLLDRDLAPIAFAYPTLSCSLWGGALFTETLWGRESSNPNTS